MAKKKTKPKATTKEKPALRVVARFHAAVVAIDLAEQKRAGELIVANEELIFQNIEKEKRAQELTIANKELAYQNEEKEKRAAELVVANKELA